MQAAVEIAGWFGAVTVVAAYFCASLGLPQPGVRFQIANLVGSSALLVNGAYHGATPSVVVNLAWFVITAVAVVRTRIVHRRAGAVSLR